MIFSHSTFGESPTAKAPQAHLSPQRRDGDAVPAPRWGLLAAAVVAAMVTAAWIGSAFTAAQPAAPSSVSAPTPGK